MNSILIVDDNIHLIALMGKMLEPLARVIFATNGQAALREMRKSRPDLVLLDQEMPGMSGDEVSAAMRDDPDLRDIPVIFVTGHNDAEAEVRALNAGAVDFIAKPVHEAILLARVKTQLRLKGLSDELRRNATLDGLTGIHNRAAFDSRLAIEWARASRNGSPLSLLLLDVDHFKQYNDHYGHPAGDRCLQAIARTVDGVSKRANDMAARVGGEEFAVLLPDTPIAGAQAAAERLRAEILALELPHAQSSTLPLVTVSIGAAQWLPSGPHAGCRPADLMDWADKALYAAKAGGRNQVALQPAADGPAALLSAGTASPMAEPI
jgi:diguanylate cyclase (GGDEF)-like protein